MRYTLSIEALLPKLLPAMLMIVLIIGLDEMGKSAVIVGSVLGTGL